ncbi:MAG TPA: YMGG-like glycine zipper-containing protein [Candidatus Angelobacter sp.]|nr:YMGG-like glycine zipper-containing protein [Candidatus Angelobacter sp.]
MKLRYGALVLCIVLVSALGWSDTLELKNGSVIKGTYVGGSETEISFRVGSSVQQYAIIDVASLKFDSRDSAAKPHSEGFATRHSDRPSSEAISGDHSRTSADRDHNAASIFPHSLTIPSGTRLLVRTVDAVDSDRNQPGDKFLSSLEEPLYVNETMVAPKGASVYGRLEQVSESGQLVGKAQLRLALTGIVINGRTFPLSTGDYELSGKSRGESTAKKVGGGAAIGALIGAIAGGGKGAAIGAGVGAGAGTAVQVMTKGDQVHVPSETLLEFSLDQPLTIPNPEPAH